MAESGAACYSPAMNAAAWTAFSAARDRCRAYVARLAAELPELAAVQQRLVDNREGGTFRVETPVVFNAALDDVRPEDDVRVVLVADNPGRREQAAENRRYLVGPSGKLADGFFRARPELGIDFRRSVVILNKTPIHTPRTVELRALAELGGERVARAIAESQEEMADLIAEFHRALSLGREAPAELWIIGYSEMAKGKLFEPFTRALNRIYGPDAGADRLPAGSVRLFRHFSMNQFSVDIRKRALPGESVEATLARVGAEYRLRVLGW
jgi:hypothetical protein